MYTTKTLIDEIDALILEKRENREAINPDWLTVEICKKYLGEYEKFDSFITLNCTLHVRDKIGKRVKEKPIGSDGERVQVMFNGIGFDLPEYTDIVREDEVVFIPTDQLTIDDCDRKIEMLETEIVGKQRLVDEYRNLREQISLFGNEIRNP